MSGNHAYGIIGISVLNTNRNEFADSIQSAIFPYRVSEGYAEFYGYVPIETKIGFTIELDSDKGIMTIFEKDRVVKKTVVAVSLEKTNIEFVRKNSKFKGILGYPSL
ncbi:hypothetical protein [Chitinophaga sp. RCC_12]|uniref:hypothetical protein n=1 Tax=Chitinophaga sp. RCC_12 TaxID=3239226 RepID=UPI0035240A5E